MGRLRAAHRRGRSPLTLGTPATQTSTAIGQSSMAQECATRRYAIEWRWKTFAAGPSQRSGEAGGSLIRGTPGRAASSPDNGGTCRDYRTVRVRLARSEGAAKANQWLKLRKHRAGSNLVDMGRYAAREPSPSWGGSTPKPDFLFRWGGHVESLRRRRGDAAGVELGVSLTDRLCGERGNHPRSPEPPDNRSGGGQVRCRLMAVGGAEAP